MFDAVLGAKCEVGLDSCLICVRLQLLGFGDGLLLVKRGLEHYAENREVIGRAENFLQFTGVCMAWHGRNKFCEACAQVVWLGMEGACPVRHVHKWWP